MRTILILPALVLALALAGCAAPHPDACRLEMVATLPIDLVDKLPVVQVEINGQPARMVLDTGSDATVLSRRAAQRLGVAETALDRPVHGAGGAVDAGSGIVDRLVLGGHAETKVRVLLADAPRPAMDGLLGISTLVAFEVVLDVPHRQVTLYRARRCPDAAPDWTAPFTRLPARQQAGPGHLFVPVTLNGETFSGLLDTGATGTALSVQAAEDIRIDRKALARLPAGRGLALNSGGVQRREVRLRSMMIGGDVLNDPVLNVIDLPPFAGDVLIGEDYLGTRRLWFSFLLGRVWVAP